MPWCPKCRNEYQKGVLLCSDCGATLVEELPEEDDRKVIMIARREEAENYYDLLIKFEIERAMLNYNMESNLYHVSVPEDQVEKAKKLAIIQKINLKDNLDTPTAESEQPMKSEHVYEIDATSKDSSVAVLEFEAEFKNFSTKIDKSGYKKRMSLQGLTGEAV